MKFPPGSIKKERRPVEKIYISIFFYPPEKEKRRGRGGEMV
jgi:hypothetical protein